MKLYRNAVILLVVLALLVGAYMIFKDRKLTDEPAIDSEAIKLFDLDSDKIKKLTLKNSDGEFVFVKEIVKQDGGELKKWMVSSPAGFNMNEDSVRSVAINISYLSAEKVIEEEAADLSMYGLDKPVILTAELDDGTVKVLEIGSDTPTKSGYYVKLGGSNKVYTIGSYTGQKLKLGKNDLRSKTLFSFNMEDVIELSMDRKGAQVFQAKKTAEYEWNMLYPIEASADMGALGKMLESLAQVNVMSFVEENPSDLGKYGLDKPSYAIELATSTVRNKLIFGAEKEKGREVYAMLAGSNEVFTISLTPFSFLDKPLKEIMEVFAYIVNISDVNKITVEMDGKTVNCELQTDKEDKEKDKFFVDGKDVSGLKNEKDNQLFRNYYQALIGVTLSDVEVGANPTGTAEITFTYYLKKAPGVVKVEFIPKDERSYYVVKNGKYSGIVVEKKKFDAPEGVRESYRLLKEAMDKQ